jgi:hypothetical protein
MSKREPNKEYDKDHAGETSEGHGRDQGKEAHQPQGAAPRLQKDRQCEHQAHRKEARRTMVVALMRMSGRGRVVK